MKPKIIAGNWKMHLSPNEAIDYFKEYSKNKDESQEVRLKRRVIFPVAYCLNSNVLEQARSCGIELGAQNMHWEEKGAFTGELSGAALKSMSIQWVLIGHSERRQFFGETDETAAKRLGAALRLGLNVIFCIGEKLEERESQQMEKVLTRQLSAFANVLKTAKPLPVIQIVSIAYEPVWAIGTGKTATPNQAEEAHAFIRGELTRLLEKGQSESIPLLYGGSVNAGNSKDLLSQPHVDGVLVGGASLKPSEFAAID